MSVKKGWSRNGPMQRILSKIFGTSNDRAIKRMLPLVERINRLEGDLSKLSDIDLRGRTPLYRERLDNGEPLDDLLPEAFATVREAAKRSLGQRHYDMQMVGGIILHEGRISEMKTGEGKTLVATLPSYLNGLTGRGVHVVTVNDFLAARDAEWMGQLHRFLGLEVGAIVHGLSECTASGCLCRRRHLLHEQRARLRLSTRQHEVRRRSLCSARAPLRHRG